MHGMQLDHRLKVKLKNIKKFTENILVILANLDAMFKAMMSIPGMAELMAKHQQKK